MHRAALVFGLGEHLAHGLQHSHALVADDELHAVQAAATQPDASRQALHEHLAKREKSDHIYDHDFPGNNITFFDI